MTMHSYYWFDLVLDVILHDYIYAELISHT